MTAGRIGKRGGGAGQGRPGVRGYNGFTGRRVITPPTAMKRLAILLILLGLALGPAYFVYCQYFSGARVASFPVAERGSAWTLPGGLTLRFQTHAAFKPVTVVLDPGMTPVGFVVNAQFAADTTARTSRSNRYHATVYLDGAPVMEKAFALSHAGGRNPEHVSHSMALGTLAVARAGQYTLVIEERGRQEIALSGIGVEVRRNVRSPVMATVWAGVALIVLGIAAAIAAQRRAAAERANWRQAGLRPGGGA